MRWSSEERAFVVEAYFSNRLSVIATQRIFRNRFNLAPRDAVPDRKSIVTWVTTFRQTGSTTRRSTGVCRTKSKWNILSVHRRVLWLKEKVWNFFHCPAYTLHTYILRFSHSLSQVLHSQICVKQNLKYVLSLWSKNKTFMSHKTCFIALWKKDV